jgi:hypothetical protein
MATKITLTALQTAAFMGARNLPDAQAKAARKNIWADLRQHWGIPDSVKLKVELDNVGASDYLALAVKSTGSLLKAENGRYVGTFDSEVAAPAQADAPVAASGNASDYVTVLLPDTQATVRYVVVNAQALAIVAENDGSLYVGDGDDDLSIEARTDAGRIVYDPVRDVLMVRING